MAVAEAVAEQQRYFPSSLEAAQRRTRIPGTEIKVPFLGRRSLSSLSPKLVRLEWTTADVDPADIAWAEVEGDPESGRRPRGWSFSILGVSRSAIAELGDRVNGENGKTEWVGILDNQNGQWATQAIVCESDGEVKVGTNPDASGHLFGGKTIEGVGMFTAAIRHGGDALKAALAYSRNGELYVPDLQPAVLAQHVPSGYEVLQDYPGTVLAG